MTRKNENIARRAYLARNRAHERGFVTIPLGYAATPAFVGTAAVAGLLGSTFVVALIVALISGVTTVALHITIERSYDRHGRLLATLAQADPAAHARGITQARDLIHDRARADHAALTAKDRRRVQGLAR